MITAHSSGAALGAEIRGVDLSKEISDAELARIVDLLHEHEVIFFRNQDITPEQHINLSKRIGPLEMHMRQECCKPGYPEIFVVSNIVENGKPIGAQDAGTIWHSDMCFMHEPSRGSLFYMKEVPMRDGQPLGDTLFSSMTAAYNALPRALRDRLEGLKAINSYAKGYARPRAGKQLKPLTEEQKNRAPDVAHPVIRTHPYTGKKCIFVNEGFTTRILDVSEGESDELLRQLTEQVKRPEFIYRHKWQVGDFLIWDNCATQHLATADYALPERRLAERTTLSGTLPF